LQEHFSELMQKKLLMVTGKGGIGKTLTSVALAQWARRQGKKVCLVESSAHDQIAPLFGIAPVGHQLRELMPGLSVINLNPMDNFRDFVIKHLGFAKLFEKVFTKPIVRSFIQTMPGIAELTLLGRLYYFSELDRDDRFDLIVLDGFASGHFHSLMKTPDAVLQSGMVGPIIDETQRVRSFIADSSKVAVALVTVPEDLVVGEALDFVARLHRETPAPLASILVNRCYPIYRHVAPSAQWPESFASGLRYWQHRSESEVQNLKRLQTGLSEIHRHDGQSWPVYCLPERGAFVEPLVQTELHEWVAAAELL
jgi:arsenite-transporting ATPase